MIFLQLWKKNEKHKILLKQQDFFNHALKNRETIKNSDQAIQVFIGIRHEFIVLKNCSQKTAQINTSKDELAGRGLLGMYGVATMS